MVPPDTQQSLLSVDIAYWGALNALAWADPMFFRIRIDEMYPFFIASDDAMHQMLTIMTFKQNFTCGFSLLFLSVVLVMRNPSSGLLDLPHIVQTSRNS